MKITRTSLISGCTNTREIAVSQAELDAWIRGEGTLIKCAPSLTPDEREFIISGITPEEWDAAFPEEADED